MQGKWLAVLAALVLPMAATAMAAEGLPGATVRSDGKGPTSEERTARMEACKANPEKCREERRAMFEKRCAENPERCKQMKEKMAKHMAECKADPEKCRKERQARFDERFKKADADNNGAISRAEAEKAMPRLVRHFERIDANKDGQVTREEMATARKAHFEQRQRERGKPGAAPGKI
jgi:EF hand